MPLPRPPVRKYSTEEIESRWKVKRDAIVVYIEKGMLSAFVPTYMGSCVLGVSAARNLLLGLSSVERLNVNNVVSVSWIGGERTVEKYFLDPERTPEDVTLDLLFFDAEQVHSLEAKYGIDVSADEKRRQQEFESLYGETMAHEKEMSKRERNNVARIIAALAVQTKLDLQKPHSAAKALEQETERLGCRVGDDTIAKWLELAAEQLPKLKRNPS